MCNLTKDAHVILKDFLVGYLVEEPFAFIVSGSFL